MQRHPSPPRHRSTALPLLAAFVAVVAYASLFPFEGWRWPPGLALPDLARLPWPPWRDRFDEAANVLGYLPLGALAFGAAVRSGVAARRAAPAALAAAMGLSYSIEVVQAFVPARVPSLRDVLGNTVGAALGIGLGALLLRLGWVGHWHALRERWFARESAAALGLMLLWPMALLFPAPVPLGLGAVWGPLRESIDALVAGSEWGEAAARWLDDAAVANAGLTPLQELLITALGLLAPCLVAFCIARARWHRAWLVAGALAVAMGVSTLSTALNFGPAQALAWWSGSTPAGLALGTLAALALLPVGARVAAAVGLAALAVAAALVAQAPADPYFAASLQGWEQGRFIRFHGLAEWVGWLWPYAAMAWLLARLARAA